MTDPITDDEIQRWQLLCEKASPGPWIVHHRHALATTEDDEQSGLGLEIEGPPEPMLRGQFARAADAAFIAACRSALPRLLAERHAGEE